MFKWSEEKFNQAKKLSHKKIPYIKIAKRLGTSKNSVMGKLFRDKVKHGHIPNANKYASNNKYYKRKEHETPLRFTKYGTDNCLICKKSYTTYSKFDRFCKICKTTDYFRNAV